GRWDGGRQLGEVRALGKRCLQDDAVHFRVVGELRERGGDAGRRGRAGHVAGDPLPRGRVGDRPDVGGAAAVVGRGHDGEPGLPSLLGERGGPLGGGGAELAGEFPSAQLPSVRSVPGSLGGHCTISSRMAEITRSARSVTPSASAAVADSSSASAGSLMLARFASMFSAAVTAAALIAAAAAAMSEITFLFATGRSSSARPTSRTEAAIRSAGGRAAPAIASAIASERAALASGVSLGSP